MTTTVLQYPPGHAVTVVLQVLNTDGYRTDGYTTPTVESIVLPDLTLSSLYPANMIKISTGLYSHKFNLPKGSSAIGSYIVSLKWKVSATATKEDVVQVICLPSSGTFSVSPV